MSQDQFRSDSKRGYIAAPTIAETMMSSRVRVFVEYWINEFLHPDLYEDEESRPESHAHAAHCVRSAARYGIAKTEIDAEYGDLVAHMARTHERIVDFQLRHPAGRGPSAAAA